MAVNHSLEINDKFFKALKRTLPPDAVKSGSETIARYARSPAAVSTQPLAVVYPQSTEEVVSVVRLADEYGVAVHPLSRGRNWGYGSACATSDGQLIMDLGRMNRIVEVNVESAYAVVEPGVTQGQLHRYLRDHDLPLWMDATGAGLQTSLVGNTLERGFGHSPHGERAANTCGMKVVLADGRVLDTALGHFDHARAARVYRHGVGPSLDGLFSQSNLGVVTQLGVWLTPEPEAFSAFFITVPEPEDLQPLVDRLAPLRLRGVLQSTVHVGNDLRVISGRRRYPWERTNGQTPLSPPLRRQLREEYGVGAWNVLGGLYGTRGVVREMRKTLRKAAKPYKVNFVDDRRLALARAMHRALAAVGRGTALGELLEVLTPSYGLLKGKPTDQPLHGAAWRVRGPLPDQPQDPRDIHAGLMWVAPVLPAQGEAARVLVELIEPIYARHGFDPMMTFTMINQRAMICVSNIAFDARQTQEADAARTCYHELTEATTAAGFPPYRTGPRGWPALDQGSTFWEVARQIKQALDPRHTISPGRYIQEAGPRQAKMNPAATAEPGSQATSTDEPSAGAGP